MNFNSDLMKNLVGVYSPSGDESKINNFIKNEIEDYVDEIVTDPLGNLIARKKGKENGKKIMIASHMDQIGFMIVDIDKNGFLKFTNVGGISPTISLGQKVIFENGTIGIIYTEPADDFKKLKLQNMYIDIGVTSKEDAKKLVNIGDICVYYSDYNENENMIISKCLDNRAGCFVAIESIKQIKNNINDLYFVFTVQEEVGLRGAKTSAYKVNPDLGIAIDVTSSEDTPETKRSIVKLNNGTAIKIKDMSVLCHPKVKQLMIDTAKQNKIKFQLEILEFGGTDSGAIHLTREGIPSGVISIPLRYVHSPIEMASKNDILNSIKLLTCILEKENIEL